MSGLCPTLGYVCWHMQEPIELAKRPSLKDIRDVIRRGGETSLYAWMSDNHADLSAELLPYRTNWKALADRLTTLGLRNTRGGPVTAAAARKTWQRVRAEIESKAGSQPRPEESPPRLNSVPTRSVPEPESPRPKPTIALRPARPADPSVPPDDDGSQLPKPVPRKGS
jgi:hypothetical protein